MREDAAASFVVRDLHFVGAPAHGAQPAAAPLHALRLDFRAGELTVLLGAPEDGGPSLLRLLAGLARPDRGAVVVDGQDLARVSAAELAAHRRTLGLALGDPAASLLTDADALTNVELPLRVRGLAPREARAAAEATLRALDFPPDRRRARDYSPAQQRVLALAAALAPRPARLLLEEPARGLDALATDDVWQQLRDYAARPAPGGAPDELGGTVIVATTDAALAARAPRTIVMREGRAIAERVRTVAFARGGGDRFEEYALLDAGGALTRPADALRAAGIDERIEVVPQPDRLELRPERVPEQEREPRWRPRPRP